MFKEKLYFFSSLLKYYKYLQFLIKELSWVIFVIYLGWLNIQWACKTFRQINWRNASGVPREHEWVRIPHRVRPWPYRSSGVGWLRGWFSLYLGSSRGHVSWKTWSQPWPSANTFTQFSSWPESTVYCRQRFCLFVGTLINYFKYLKEEVLYCTTCYLWLLLHLAIFIWKNYKMHFC